MDRALPHAPFASKLRALKDILSTNFETKERLGSLIWGLLALTLGAIQMKSVPWRKGHSGRKTGMGVL